MDFYKVTYPWFPMIVHSMETITTECMQIWHWIPSIATQCTRYISIQPNAIHTLQLLSIAMPIWSVKWICTSAYECIWLHVTDAKVYTSRNYLPSSCLCNTFLTLCFLTLHLMELHRFRSFSLSFKLLRPSFHVISAFKLTIAIIKLIATLSRC